MRNIQDFEGPGGPEKPHEREIRTILLILETRIGTHLLFCVLTFLKCIMILGILLLIRIDGRLWKTIVRSHLRNSSDIRAETKKM